MPALRALMTNLIDYAGLFPPARLEMGPAVEMYRGHRRLHYAWMLGKYICPVTRFAEMAAAVECLEWDDGKPYLISALLGADRPKSLRAIAVFEDRHEGRFEVAAVEVKVQSASEIDELIDLIPEPIVGFFEIPIESDYRGMITAIAGSGHGAKIRTGGVAADLFPTVASTAEFIVTCHRANVPFKATAGLHHPLRHHNDQVDCMMHGFLNIFGAAVACRHFDLEQAEVERIIASKLLTEFRFDGDQLRILDWTLTAEEIATARAQFACAFGSCSFLEPTEDLQALKLLDF